MMAYPSYDLTLIFPWVCPECLYENKDYQQCMVPDCNSVMPGGMIETSQFAGVAINNPLLLPHMGMGRGRHQRRPPLLNKSLHCMQQRQMLLQVL
jgi:hypothetical protein